MSRFVALRLLCWIQVGNLTRLEHRAQCQILQFQDQDRQRRAEIILYIRPTPIRQASTMSPVRLQVTVMIAAFVVATISSTAATSPFSPMSTAFPHETTSTPKPPPTTSSSQCWRDGQLVEGLEPGGSMQKDCEFCECFDGEVFCCYVGCGPAMCWDSLLSECCRSCPNGEKFESQMMKKGSGGGDSGGGGGGGG